MRECNLVFCPYLLSDDKFTYIIELVPVFVERVHAPIQWLELGPTADGEEGIFVGQIASIIVMLVGKKNTAESIKIGSDHRNPVK